MPSRDFRPPSRQPWPFFGLDVRALRESRWEARPFRQFVLKLHSRCNLSCTYCYVYEMADQSWAIKPKMISAETLRQTALRIADHVRDHRLTNIEVVFHGGEPLLCGEQFIVDAADCLRDTIPAGTALTIRLQTNGTLLTAPVLDALLEQDIKVGVSFDGTARSHDAKRIYANGRGSHTMVTAALRLLASEPYTRIFSGTLCTIDITSDPLETYESLLEFSPPRVDFLLPHANWSAPPSATRMTQYGEWMTAAFDHWYDSDSPVPQIRLFDEIITMLLGGHSTIEAIGLTPVALVVVDTDGSMEQVDTLKSTFSGAPQTGLSVFTHSFDDALGHPAIVARQIGGEALSEICQACPVREICGGGYFPHRYRAENGFKNPSVYCSDLRYLITHISHRIHHDLLGSQRC